MPIFSVLLCEVACSHESRPLYVEIVEFAPYQYQLKWKVPPSIPAFGAPSVALPNVCRSLTLSTEPRSFDGLEGHVIYICDRDIARLNLEISYPYGNPSISTLIRYSTYSGEQHVNVLGPDRMSWTVPPSETICAAASEYFRLGVMHILTGFDHLLFVICLLWIAGSWRRMLVTITGFTLAHSGTLVLSTLKIVNIPAAPVEAAIALSIIFVATELVKGPRKSLTWRAPISVSSSFGLLHGFGFAAALLDVGLPQTERAIGLLFFNIGVEVGHLLFLAVVAVLVRILRLAYSVRIQVAGGVNTLRVAAGYVVGVVASLWFFERCTTVFTSVSTT